MCEVFLTDVIRKKWDGGFEWSMGAKNETKEE